jgi:hypothetical protein
MWVEGSRRPARLKARGRRDMAECDSKSASDRLGTYHRAGPKATIEGEPQGGYERKYDTSIQHICRANSRTLSRCTDEFEHHR